MKFKKSISIFTIALLCGFFVQQNSFAKENAAFTDGTGGGGGGEVDCYSTFKRGGGGDTFIACGDCKDRRSTEVYDPGKCTK